MVVVAVVAAVVAIAAGIAVGRPSQGFEAVGVTESVTLATVTEVSSVELTVHVAGAVARPGLVKLSDGARVAQALQEAGGVTLSADLTGVNLAATVIDGQQVVVPEIGDNGSVGRAVSSDDKVRINSADEAALEGLPGVGPVLAANIVAYRELNGPFSVVEDLLSVSGIGEAKLATIRTHVVVP